MKKLFLSLLGALALASGASAAVVTTVDCSSPIVTGSQAPDVWYTDRYAPAGFACDGGVLKQTISSVDSASNRPASYSSSFYNTQGRKLDLASGISWVSADLYVDPTWSSERIAGFWATGVDGASAIASYPILEFAFGGFRGWDSAGIWGATTAIVDTDGDNWYTLYMALVGNTIEYWVNDTFLYAFDSYGTLSLDNMMLQGYNNFGPNDVGTRDILWDNLMAGNNVPEPASSALVALALAGAGFPGAMRRLRAKHKRKMLGMLHKA
jgi:hypothetical protein